MGMVAAAVIRAYDYFVAGGECFFAEGTILPTERGFFIYKDGSDE
jgi:hypothetical protein